MQEMPKCLCPKCQPIGGKFLSWRTWRQHQKNKNIHNMSTNSLSNPIQHISTSSAKQATITFNTLNYYFFDDQNETNFDVAKLNIMESSSVKNNSLSQECSKSTTNRSSCRKSKKLPVMQLDNLPMNDYNQSEFDNNFNQSEHDNNSNRSEDNNSEQSNDIIQSIEEEIDEESDEDYNEITPSLSNINNLNIFPKPLYNPIHLLYNPPLKIWKEFLDEKEYPFFVEDSADVRIGLAFNLD
ncbi:18230_t:CDS:2 [Dentiscutata erythropus]|uniref:18230_t:CDS:1 n=1 Tax=Dentiscutata erythropus TaxID=1348616 RepID=A0A9N9DYV1_9GLOM|nr:18230_t:CDS:2 [Dentiscutata erythropus]